ncbi:hypothetical protein HMPREF1986_01503 [Oribacterium sp. oral taxon 078 str. F0263]|nr:hypothetical protein HMPREF1986_01503 [Oribacterium sp. oral taxon 078 str. F0263]
MSRQAERSKEESRGFSVLLLFVRRGQSVFSQADFCRRRAQRRMVSESGGFRRRVFAGGFFMGVFTDRCLMGRSRRRGRESAWRSLRAIWIRCLESCRTRRSSGRPEMSFCR